MDRGLRDETIGEGNADDASNERSATQQEEIPMKASGLLQRKLFCLCRERADVVIIVKEEGQENSDGKRDKNPFHGKIPKVNEPAAIDSRVECTSVRDSWKTGFFDTAGNVGEACPEDGCNLE